MLTVNYNTPELVDTMISSVRSTLGDNISVHVVDGSDQVKYNIKKDNNVTHHDLGYNIHHGPGMHYGVCKIDTPYTLIVDSDVIVLKDLLSFYNQHIRSEFYACGISVHVNSGGFNVEPVETGSIKYIHPQCMLLDNKMYNQYKPFVKHGAPCINTMKDIKEHNHEHLLIGVDFNCRDAVNNPTLWEHEGRATINKWGLNI